MPSYLVETYVPRGRAHELVTVGDAIRAAIAELEGEGVVVTYVRTTLLPARRQTRSTAPGDAVVRASTEIGRAHV